MEDLYSNGEDSDKKVSDSDMGERLSDVMDGVGDTGGDSLSDQVRSEFRELSSVSGTCSSVMSL